MCYDKPFICYKYTCKGAIDSIVNILFTFKHMFNFRIDLMER